MALSKDQNFALHFEFGDHLFIFRAEIKHESDLFKAENNSQTTSKQLQNNFQKAQKKYFFSPEIVKMILSKSQILTYNFILDITYRPFKLKILLKTLIFEVKNNSQTSSEPLQTNLQKVKMNDFFCPKNDQITGNKFGKSVNFIALFWPKSLNRALKSLKPILTHFCFYAWHLKTLKTWKASS